MTKPVRMGSINSDQTVFVFLLKFSEVRGTLLVAQLVEALRYKPEGCGFDSRRCY
jgi:hypothetical protein